MTHPRKTTRNYGQKWNLIRAFAMLFDRPFTPHVFTPALTYRESLVACLQLYRRGELMVLSSGTHANYKSQPPVYVRVPKPKGKP